MSESTGAKAKIASPKEDLAAVLAAATQTRTTTAAKTNVKATAEVVDARFAQIESNPFYQIMFNDSIAEEDKASAIAKAQTMDCPKEEMREREAAFELFKEWLQSKREAMAKQIIALTDTEVFAELQTIYKDMDESLHEFNEDMKPLTDIVSALYKLRADGKTFDILNEIRQDKAKEAERTAKKAAQENELAELQVSMQTLRGDIAAKSTERGMFGLGGPSKATQAEIARKNVELGDKAARLEELGKERTTLLKEAGEEGGAYALEKSKVRELLDLTRDEHKARQSKLIGSATGFIETSKSRSGSVRQHLGKMNGQIENLADANFKMVTIYATLDEGLSQAEKANRELLDTKFAPPADGQKEGSIARITREQKRIDIDEHMTALAASASDTMTTLTDLSSATVRIKTMKDANRGQSDKIAKMHTQGVAGVADRLSTVLQAVNAAALSESSAMVSGSMSQMIASTNTVAQKEVIRIAMGLKEGNAELEQAISDLDDWKKVTDVGVTLSREAIQEGRANLGKLRTMAEDLGKSTREAIAIHADAALGVQPKSNDNANGGAAPQLATAPKKADPFKLG